MKSCGVSYLLWCLMFVGLFGIHRFYNGKILSGLVWLFTFGLLGFGQLIDLVLIPGMVSNANLRSAVFAAHRNVNTNTNTNNVIVNVAMPPTSTPPVVPNVSTQNP